MPKPKKRAERTLRADTSHRRPSQAATGELEFRWKEYLAAGAYDFLDFRLPQERLIRSCRRKARP